MENYTQKSYKTCPLDSFTPARRKSTLSGCESEVQWMEIALDILGDLFIIEISY